MGGGRGGKCCEVQWLEGGTGDTVLRGGNPGSGGVPAPQLAQPPHPGPLLGVCGVGRRWGTGCHDRLTRLMVGCLASLWCQAVNWGQRWMDGWTEGWMDGQMGG